jgi:3-oxoacyl-[acyl-carrier-protein] synthase III
MGLEYNMEKIIICVDNEHIEAKGEVLKQILLDRENYEKREIAKAAEAQAKAEAKAAAQAKLAALGLTVEDLQALGL